MTVQNGFYEMMLEGMFKTSISVCKSISIRKEANTYQKLSMDCSSKQACMDCLNTTVNDLVGDDGDVSELIYPCPIVGNTDSYLGTMVEQTMWKNKMQGVLGSCATPCWCVAKDILMEQDVNIDHISSVDSKTTVAISIVDKYKYVLYDIFNVQNNYAGFDSNLLDEIFSRMQNQLKILSESIVDISVTTELLSRTTTIQTLSMGSSSSSAGLSVIGMEKKQTISDILKEEAVTKVNVKNFVDLMDTVVRGVADVVFDVAIDELNKPTKMTDDRREDIEKLLSGFDNALNQVSNGDDQDDENDMDMTYLARFREASRAISQNHRTPDLTNPDDQDGDKDKDKDKSDLLDIMKELGLQIKDVSSAIKELDPFGKLLEWINKLLDHIKNWGLVIVLGILLLSLVFMYLKSFMMKTALENVFESAIQQNRLFGYPRK